MNTIATARFMEEQLLGVNMPRSNTKWVLKIFLMGLILSLGSCSMLKKTRQEMPAGYAPYFQGVITPIASPVEIKYHPSHNSFQVWTMETAKMSELDICELFLIGRPLDQLTCATHVNKYGNTIEMAKEERTLTGKIDVLRYGEKLVWGIESLAVSVDGQEWRPDLPINHIQIVSDCYGSVSEIEVSFPALMEAGVQDVPKPGTKGYEKVIQLFKQSLMPLPSKPISTGDSLHSFGVAEMVADMLAFWGEQDVQQLLAAIEARQDDLRYEIKGWSMVNNVKVLVAELRFRGSVNIKGKPMHVNNRGYVLLDTKSGHIVHRENLSRINYGGSEFKVLYKFASKPAN